MRRGGGECLGQSRKKECRRLFVGRRRSSEEGESGKTSDRGEGETDFFGHGSAPVSVIFGFVRFLWFALKINSGRFIYCFCYVY